MEISASFAPSLLPLTSRAPRPSSFSFSASSKSPFLRNNVTASFLKKIGTARPSATHRPKRLRCNCLFGLGVPELVVIAGVAALVFGPKKLPEVGKSIGKTVKSFQQAAKELESELKKEPESLSDAPAEKPRAVNEEDEQGVKISNSKESSTA